MIDQEKLSKNDVKVLEALYNIEQMEGVGATPVAVSQVINSDEISVETHLEELHRFGYVVKHEIGSGIKIYVTNQKAEEFLESQ